MRSSFTAHHGEMIEMKIDRGRGLVIPASRIYWEHGDSTLILGSSLSLPMIEDESISCVITSPPYYLQRSYDLPANIWGGDKHPHLWGDDSYCSCGAWRGVLGEEPTPQQYVENLCLIFDEMWRVLKPDGTVWLNIGDKRVGSGGAHTKINNPGISQSLRRQGYGETSPEGEGYRRKSLYGIPARMMIAMMDRGWILKNDIIWEKSRAMPENVKDRFAQTTEHILFFTKESNHYFNWDAVAEDKSLASAVRYKYPLHGKRNKGWDEQYAIRAHEYTKEQKTSSKRNPRDVWHFAPRGYRSNRKTEHYAVFPIELPLKALQAGCPPSGVVLDPFSGAATTLVAAKQLGVKSIGVDIKKEYLDISIERLLNSYRRTERL